MVVQVPKGIPYLGYWTIAVLVILCVVTTAIVGLRLYSRCKILKRSLLGWTDWCIIVSTVGMLVFAALQISNMLKYGARVHMYHKKFDKDHLEAHFELWQTTYIQRVFYELSSCLIKLSILLFLYTLSPYRSFHLLIYFLMFLDVALSITTTVMVLLQCIPLRAAFLPPSHRPPGSRCFDVFVSCQVLPVCNAVLDAMCWLIPMHLAWQASNRWKERLRVAMVLCMGLTAVIASVMRIVILKWALAGNPTRFLWGINFWAFIEIAMAIICACSPALMPIIRHIYRKIKGPNYAKRSRRTSAAVRRELENIEVGLNSGPSISLKKIGDISTDASSNHENIPGLGITEHQDSDSFHAVHINGGAHYASTEAFAIAGSTGESLSRASSGEPSREAVDASSNHECSFAHVERGSCGGGGTRRSTLEGVTS